MHDPCSCAASSASAICRAIGSASSSGSGPRAIAREVLALDELHHERAHARRRLLEPVDRRDVRVVELREELRFALEARQALGIGGERRPAAP